MFITLLLVLGREEVLKPNLRCPLYSPEKYLAHNLSWAKAAMSLALLSYKIEPKTEIIKFLKYQLSLKWNICINKLCKKFAWCCIPQFNAQKLFPDKNHNKKKGAWLEWQVMSLMPFLRRPAARYNTRFCGTYHHSKVLYQKGWVLTLAISQTDQRIKSLFKLKFRYRTHT